MAVSSDSSRNDQEVLLAQLSLRVNKDCLNPYVLNQPHIIRYGLFRLARSLLLRKIILHWKSVWLGKLYVRAYCSTNIKQAYVWLSCWPFIEIILKLIWSRYLRARWGSNLHRRMYILSSLIMSIDKIKFDSSYINIMNSICVRLCGVFVHPPPLSCGCIQFILFDIL